MIASNFYNIAMFFFSFIFSSIISLQLCFGPFLSVCHETAKIWCNFSQGTGRMVLNKRCSLAGSFGEAIWRAKVDGNFSTRETCSLKIGFILHVMSVMSVLTKYLFTSFDKPWSLKLAVLPRSMNKYRCLLCFFEKNGRWDEVGYETPMKITEMDKTFSPHFGDLISFSHLYKSGFDTKIEIPPEKSHPMSTTKNWASVSSLFPPWPVGHLHFGLPVIAPSAGHARIIHIHILRLSDL